jgi:hypothetical protein
MTTLDCYRLFLDGIKKERTSIVSPSYFNRLINDVQLDWLNAKAPVAELTQDIIDDLSQLRVVTDGSQTFKGHVLNVIPATPTYALSFPLPKATNLSFYPRYFRLLNVQFLISYLNPITGAYSYDLGLEYASILRSDKRAVTPSNYYRRAKKGRLYYEIIGNDIRAVSQEQCRGGAMRLEYLRYPEQIWLDETNMADHSNETGNPYTNGYGSIPCELGEIQTKEIISLAVSTYLERNSDPRFQSYLQDQQMKQ